jgi:hypothetical protein
VSAGLSQAERWAQYGRRHPEIIELPPQERPDVGFAKLFGEVSAPAALVDLLPEERVRRADVEVAPL